MYKTNLSKNKETEELNLVQFEDNGLTIISNADLQTSAMPINVGDSVSVKNGKEYIAATILGQGKFTQPSHICTIQLVSVMCMVCSIYINSSTKLSIYKL